MYPPAIFTIYSGFSNCFHKTTCGNYCKALSDNNEDKNKLYKLLGGISMSVTS